MRCVARADSNVRVLVLVGHAGVVPFPSVLPFIFISFFLLFPCARERRTEKERDRRRALLNCQPPLPRFLFNFIEPAYAIVIMGGLVRYGTSVRLRADGFLNFCNALCILSRATLLLFPFTIPQQLSAGKTVRTCRSFRRTSIFTANDPALFASCLEGSTIFSRPSLSSVCPRRLSLDEADLLRAN